MSIRAHRVEKIKTNGDSFNLWHDEKIMDWLRGKTFFFHSLNGDCCGLTEVTVDDLKTMLSEISGEIDEYTREAIEKDIMFAEERGDWSVQYYCF